MRISGGKHAKIELPMLVFKNSKHKHPILGFIDDVTGVCYRTAPKGWMDGWTNLGRMAG